jgi:hypothetical protein
MFCNLKNLFHDFSVHMLQTIMLTELIDCLFFSSHLTLLHVFYICISGVSLIRFRSSNRVCHFSSLKTNDMSKLDE